MGSILGVCANISDNNSLLSTMSKYVFFEFFDILFNVTFAPFKLILRGIPDEKTLFRANLNLLSVMLICALGPINFKLWILISRGVLERKGVNSIFSTSTEYCGRYSDI